METKELEEMKEQELDKALDESIDPEEIVFDDDSDMPAPETKTYDNDVKYVKCTDMFMNLFNSTVGALPYATILKNQQGEQIKLVDLVNYVESRKDKISLNEMNRIIAFIANLEFKYARQLMEVVENKAMHKKLWELIED